MKRNPRAAYCLTLATAGGICAVVRGLAGGKAVVALDEAWAALLLIATAAAGGALAMHLSSGSNRRSLWHGVGWGIGMAVAVGLAWEVRHGGNLSLVSIEGTEGVGVHQKIVSLNPYLTPLVVAFPVLGFVAGLVTGVSGSKPEDRIWSVGVSVLFWTIGCSLGGAVSWFAYYFGGGIGFETAESLGLWPGLGFTIGVLVAGFLSAYIAAAVGVWGTVLEPEQAEPAVSKLIQ